MTPEDIQRKILELIAKQTGVYKSDMVRADSLALSLKSTVPDIMVHLSILEAEGSIILNHPKATRNPAANLARIAISLPLQ